jgi:predicted PurR-regulated permease PerM
MRITRHAALWIAIAVTALVMLILLRHILLPFVVGMALAYLLAPIVSSLERLGINRALATLTLVLLLVFGLVAFLLLTFPLLAGEVTAFVETFPDYVARIQALVTDANRPWLGKILGHELHGEPSASQIVTTVGGRWLEAVLRWLWSGGEAFLSMISLLVVTPIVAIYLTIDWDRMITAADTWIAPEHRDEIRALGREINGAVAGFIRGQTVICLILAVLYATVLRSVGLHHGVLIGLIAGLISFVPYLGAGTGFVVSMCVAVSQFWPNWTPIIVVGGTFLIGEMLADYVLAPRIIGRRVKLNPVWLMFALFAFGSLFGFVGLLIAVPLAAALGVLLRFAIRKSGGPASVVGPTPSG